MLWRLIAPQNQALFLMMSPHLDAVFMHVLQGIAGAAALRDHFRRRVVGLEVLVGVEQPA